MRKTTVALLGVLLAATTYYWIVTHPAPSRAAGADVAGILGTLVGRLPDPYEGHVRRFVSTCMPGPDPWEGDTATREVPAMARETLVRLARFHGTVPCGWSSGDTLSAARLIYHVSWPRWDAERRAYFVHVAIVLDREAQDRSQRGFFMTTEYRVSRFLWKWRFEKETPGMIT
jgi:hypothetical protein